MSVEVIVNKELCQGCGACVEACPNAAIHLRDGIAFIDRSKCSFCQSCMDVCPTGALEVNRATQPAVLPKPVSMEVVRANLELGRPPSKESWGMAALSLLGQHVLPRIVDVLLAYLERRSATTAQDQKSIALRTETHYPLRRRRQRRGRMMQ